MWREYEPHAKAVKSFTHSPLLWLDTAHWDCQSLLAGGGDVDRLNLFRCNLAANQCSADFDLASQTEPGFQYKPTTMSQQCTNN